MSRPTAGDGEQVEQALEKVQHPMMGMNVLEAGLVHRVDVDGDHVTVELDETTIEPRMEAGLEAAIEQAVTSVDDITSSTVERVFPDEDGGDAGFEAVDTVLAVASAKGGVGKSTVAVQLACALAADHDVGLFDADVYGPNVPTILDTDGPVHTTDQGDISPVEVGGLETMSAGYMQDDGPLAWRGSVAHEALTELAAETAWSDRDVLVLDLPPGTGDVVLTILQEAPVDGVLFVTIPFETSVDDTSRSIDLFADHGVPVVGVVSNMSRYSCPCCGEEQSLFPQNDTLEAVDAPLLAELPFDTDLQRTPEPGQAPGAFADLGQQVLDRLDELSPMDIPEDAVDVRGLAPDDRYDAVRDAFERRDRGEVFVLRSDRDPSPVRAYLAELADTDPAVFDLTVEQHGPDEWVLRTQVP